MAILFADRVRVNTSTTGTGTINLGTAVAGFRTFATAVTAGALASGCTVYYAIEDSGSTWEIGSGTYTAGSPDTMSRTVAASSAGGTTALTLSGSAQVYITLTAASVVTATTPAVDNNTTSVATTAFVLGQTSSSTPAALGVAAAGSSTRYARSDHVHLLPTRNTIDFGTTGLTYASTIATNCALGNIFTVTLTGNATMGAPTNIQAGAHYTFVLTQDGTGSRTLAYNAVFKFANKTAPTLTTAASAVDVLTCFSPDGTNLYCILSANFG